MVKKVLIGLFILIDLIIVTVLALYFYTTSTVSAKLEQKYTIPDLDLAAAVKEADVELGKRIVTVRNGCIDCHGPNLAGAKVMDNGAMGTIYGSNITPAFLKDWTDQEIGAAIRHGVGTKGKNLILMPSHEYTHLSKGDLAAVIAYLRSVEPVNTPSVPVSLGPIANALIAFDKAPSMIPAQLIDHQLPFAEKPEEESTPEFGKYLAATTCAGCHGPQYKGGPIPGGPPDWPPAADLTQLKSWKEADFYKAMQEGVRPDGSQIKMPMPKFTQHNGKELGALWLYLSSL